MTTPAPREQITRTVQSPEMLANLGADLLELLPVAVYFCDAEGLLVRWNQRAEQLWGRQPVAGDPTERYCGSVRLYQSDGTPMAHGECPVAEALRTGESQQTAEAVVEHPDGTQRYVVATIATIRDESGALVGAVNVLQDITAKKQAEQALSQMEQRFRHLLEKLPAAAYTCDPDGLITYFNERAVTLWGRSPQLNQSIDRFCGSFRLFALDGSPIQHDQCWMALALRNCAEYEGMEIVIERPDGTRRHALAYATPFHEPNGSLAGAVNVLIDITERKQAQARINRLLQREKEQSDRLREADARKDEFLAMLAHELRNPLAPIRSGLDILALDGNSHRETVGLMQEQVEHVIRLVDDLLDVSRIMRGKVELRQQPVDLAVLIRRSVQAVQPLVNMSGQHLAVSLPDEPVWVNADPIRLVQVFENLLNNASKYTEEKGQIELVLETRGKQAVTQVRDSGVGIDSDLLPKVFDLFTQASRSLDRAQGGLGIGLTLVQRIVEQHGGSVSAYSDGPGHGSSFAVRLERIESPLPVPGSPQTEVTTSGRRILIVDDNKGAAQLLRLLLQRIDDHQVDVVYDGPTAVQRIRETHPELVLLDIGLPGMDGHAVAREIRRDPQFDDVVLVALTGYGQEDDIRRSKEAGFDEHVVKPPSFDHIQQILAHPRLA